MLDNWLERAELLMSNKGIQKLRNSNVLIIGLGGVGSFASEFIVRSGIGSLTIVDGDIVDSTNRNRQLPALVSTIGKYKVEVVGGRLLDINPKLNLTKINEFLIPERMEEVILSRNFDYIIDCIDSVSPKVDLILIAKKNKIKILSAMGAGGKVDPTKVKIRDLSKTKVCPLAKNIRKRLKKRNVDKGIRCVFSTEVNDHNSLQITDGTDYKQSYYGTNSYMPALFGLYAASEVIRKLSKV